MKEKSSQIREVIEWIDEKTLLPISFVIIVCAAVFWIAMLAHSAKTSEIRIDALKRQLQDHSKDVNIKIDYVHGVMLEMNRSLGRIEGKLDIDLGAKNKPSK